MIAWIRTPDEPMRELRPDEKKPCDGAPINLITCDKAGALTICDAKEVAKAEHDYAKDELKCKTPMALGHCTKAKGLHVCD